MVATEYKVIGTRPIRHVDRDALHSKVGVSRKRQIRSPSLSRTSRAIRSRPFETPHYAVIVNGGVRAHQVS